MSTIFGPLKKRSKRLRIVAISIFFCYIFVLVVVARWGVLTDVDTVSHSSPCWNQPHRLNFLSPLLSWATRLVMVRKIPNTSGLEELHRALETMQTVYFEPWLGTWPQSIDWTAAVLGTHVSASLATLTRSIDYMLPPRQGQEPKPDPGALRVENEINRYFSQSIAFYFGENALDIRFEAYDDMLWVVLGWLENIRFIDLHSSLHDSGSNQFSNIWYGRQFTPGFAHRARIFYDIAKRGWDTRLCGGGMLWNPRLLPYKNAITNQLFISASVNMYLYSPGDNNTSPFIPRSMSEGPWIFVGGTSVQPHDPRHLQSAVNAYEWLTRSNMTNPNGLYVDGFHVRDYGKNHSIGTGKCDIRNEMVYTYNQGVVLSGLRGLWESTGRIEYLKDGHRLIRNVILATGWDLRLSKPVNSSTWHGIGRNGVLEDSCDSLGSCSQDSQAFKGIFFHHYTQFCAPLPLEPAIPGVSFSADTGTASLHKQSCRKYASWVAHNAVAAMSTRDSGGRFGMWWGSSQISAPSVSEEIAAPGTLDHRNRPITGLSPPVGRYAASSETKISLNSSDVNDRGRGRTVETQSGGLAVVRALWETTQLFEMAEVLTPHTTQSRDRLWEL